MRRNHYNWMGIDNSDVPMISPHLIPPGYIQDWSHELGEWILVKSRGASKKGTVHNSFDMP